MTQGKEEAAKEKRKFGGAVGRGATGQYHQTFRGRPRDSWLGSHANPHAGSVRYVARASLPAGCGGILAAGLVVLSG
jgi:hypothetical protein